MIAHKARDAMAGDTIEAIADRGYYKGEEIVACEQAGIAVAVSKPNATNAAVVGRFDRADFVYRASKDAYMCPAGTYRYMNEETGKKQLQHAGHAVERYAEKAAVGATMRRSISHMACNGRFATGIDRRG